LNLAIWDLGEPRIKLVDETSLIHFDVTGPSPQAAQSRAAAVLEAFLSELDDLRADELSHRESVSRAAIDDYARHVQSLRDQIEAAQLESGLLSFAHYEALIDDQDRLREDLADVELARDEADAGLADLAQRLDTDPDPAALTLRLHADPEFQELVARASEKAAQFADRRGRYGPKHPQVTAAARARDGAFERLYTRAAMVTGLSSTILPAAIDLAPEPGRSGLLSDLVAQASACEELRVRAERLSQQLDAKQVQLDRLAPLASRLDDLSRDYQVAEAVFASALARTDTSKAEVYASYPLVQVLEDASLPEHPTSPKAFLAIAAGVVACLMVIMGLVLAWIRRPLIDRLLHRGAEA